MCFTWNISAFTASLERERERLLLIDKSPYILTSQSLLSEWQEYETDSEAEGTLLDD